MAKKVTAPEPVKVKKTIDFSYELLVSKTQEFLNEHQAFIDKKNKQAAKRARLALRDVKKMVTAYSKQTNEDCKNIKK